MKPGIHPDYHPVLFVDLATGTEWVTRSTATSAETREVDGATLPVVKLDISAYSHPFWSGHAREMDTAGQIERFRRRYGKK
jgi:large subunit ribosomal protein L31